MNHCVRESFKEHILKGIITLLASYLASFGLSLSDPPSLPLSFSPSPCFHASLHHCLHTAIPPPLFHSTPNRNPQLYYFSYDTVDVYPASLGLFEKSMSIEHATWCHIVQKKSLFPTLIDRKKNSGPTMPVRQSIHLIPAIFVAFSGALAEKFMCLCRRARVRHDRSS